MLCEKIDKNHANFCIYLKFDLCYVVLYTGYDTQKIKNKELSVFKGLKRWFSKPKKTSGYVYYVKFIFEGEVFYKLGFTTKNSLSERFSYSGSDDFKSIKKIIFFTYRPNAWYIEQDLLDYFEKHLAFGKYSNDSTKPLAGNGQSELFKTDVLGLDEELYKVPDHLREDYRKRQQDAVDNTILMFFLIIITWGFWAIVLIVMWLVDLLSTPQTLPIILSKPQHPHHIQEIINTLVDDSKCREN